MVEGIKKDSREITFDDFFERIPAFGQAVVGETVLGEVVGFYFFAPHTAADGGGPAGLDFGEAFLFGFFPEFGAEDLEGDLFVSGLETLLADGDDDPGGLVGKSDGGIDLVDVLAPRTTGGGKLPF